MSHYERDSPRERELQLRHQHSASSSDHNMRALVPMWDSSDPERAPPPLPLNPQSPVTSRAGTSSAIQSAHAAMNERAREANALVPAIPKRLADHSPERALVKGNHSHRRMQSLQPGTVRDMSMMIESNSNSPATSPTKFTEKLLREQRVSTPTPSAKKSDLEMEFDAISIDKDFMSGSPVPGPSLTPIVRPTVRRPQTQSILGENTPPQSSTMLALQTMGSPPPLKEAEPVLSNITNGAAPSTNGPQSFDQITEQMINITNIATSLQKEMAQLSRRSRDNATDLLSLKEATNNRDEDIRKSLKDLLSGVSETSSRLSSNHFGGLFLDNKPHDNSPGRFQLPRIPSPKSFSDSFERASVSTPSLVGGDSTTSIALLEKIIRDMGTREGQEALISRLTEVSHLISGMATATKVDELLDQVRLQSESAILHENGVMTSRARNLSAGEESNVSADKPRNHGIVSHRVDQILHNGEGRRSAAPAGREILNEDLIKIIRSVKDSVAQGGGLTAEVKALVRELRGEVLGMGREIGKRLEQVSLKGIEDTEPPSKDEVSRVIDEGLEQMKDQLNHVLREHRRQSAQSAATAKTLVDYNEIYNAMRTALKDNEASRSDIPDLSRDDVIDAVRDAWEAYKPEISVEQIGLERDEVLACLQEGLREYAPRDERPVGATREEVFKAVVEGLKHFVPPQVETPATLSRDEIIEAVRDCLEEFEFPIAPSAVGNDLSREDMIHAVREGLNDFDLPRAGAVVPHSNNNEQLLSRLEDVIGYLKLEFKAVSQEAKDNVAANGRDTEQVLDATKDGLENLRVAIESYVDRVAGHDDHDDLKHEILNSMETFKEDIAVIVSQSVEASSRVSEPDEDLKQELLGSMDTFKEDIARLISRTVTDAPRELPRQEEFNQELMKSMDSLKQDISALMTQSSQSSREQLQTELEGLREIVNSSMVPATPQQGNNKEVLEALHTAVNSIRQEILRPRNETAEIIDALNEGLNDIRAGIDRMSNKPADLTANDEILDALKSGLDSVRSDIGGIREDSNDRAVAAVGRPTDIDEQAIIPADMVKQDDIKNLEVLITQLRMKLDAMETEPTNNHNHQDDFARLEDMLGNMQKHVEALGPEPTVDHKDDFFRLEEILGSVQKQVEELGTREVPVAAPVAAAAAAVPRSLDGEAPAPAPPSGDVASREDVEAIETILRNTKARLDDLIDGEQAVRKEHLDVVETLTLETRESMLAMVGEMEAITRKEDLSTLETLVTEVRLGFEELKEKMIKDEEEQKEDPEKVTKTDVEAVETVVLEMKNILDAELPKKEDLADIVKKEDLAELAKKEDLVELARKEDLADITTKEDISEMAKKEDLADLAKKEDLVDIAMKADVADLAKKEDLADISKKEDLTNIELILTEAKEKLDTHTDSTKEALEKRQEEINGVAEKVGEVKVFLEEFQEVLKIKLDDEATGVEALGKLLEGMGEKVDKSENVPTDLKEMFDTMKAEFEDSKTIFAGAKLESDEKLQEARDSLGTKIDEKVGELIAKYDEFQTVLDERNKVAEDRDIVTEAAVVDTKAVAEELKILIDTLGASVTESVDKMEEASKTVFGRVEDLVTKNDENHEEDKSEHQQTRDQLQQAVTVVEGMQSELKESQPKVLEAIHELLQLVNMHFEHSKSSTTDIQDKIIEAKPEKLLLPPPPEKYDDTVVLQKLDNLADSKYDDSRVREMIEKLSELKYDDTELREKLEEIKYDDTGLREKLEDLKYDDSSLREKVDELKYDDSGLREKLEELKYDDSGLREKLDEIKYDDSSLREKLEELKYDDTGLREKLEELKYDDAGLREKLEELKYDDTGLREKMDELAQLKYDDSEVHQKLDKLADAKYDDTEIHEKLDTLVLMKYDDTDVHEKLDKLAEEKYDDKIVQEKLDQLVDYGSSTEQALVQLQTLDKVHQSVVKTAADISNFLSSQTQRIADDHEDREKTLQDLLTSVARRRAEKDHLDAAIASLRDEEERLRNSIMGLRTEQESLIRQKTRLTGDVSSLETAMRLRKEDLSDMESRAEKLERRILEGVMDHSRVLIMSKATKSNGDSMNRKRVKKTAAVAEGSTTPKAARPVMNMALSGQRNLAPPGQAGVARRIASLGQITNNVASGGVKRSQSVRTPASSKTYRKRSWGGDIGLGDTDKENMSVRETVEEVDENETPGAVGERVDGNGDELLGDDQSDTGTLLRGSRGNAESEAGYSEYEDTATESATDIHAEGNDVVVL